MVKASLSHEELVARGIAERSHREGEPHYALDDHGVWWVWVEDETLASGGYWMVTSKPR